MGAVDFIINEVKSFHFERKGEKGARGGGVDDYLIFDGDLFFLVWFL